MRRLAAALILGCFAAPLAAWDSVGHRVVAQIAWQDLDPSLRQRAAELLAAMPSDSGLAEMSPSVAAEQQARQRFLDASVWPDVVRDEAFPARRQLYHRGRWHYVNHFWDQPSDAAPRVRDDLRPPAENVVRQIGVLADRLRDPAASAADRAIALAWLLHLVGDIHQPLHTTARVTATEPEGDRGGNLFELRRRDNLHRYWDGTLRREYPRQTVEQLAEQLGERFPRAASSAALDEQRPASWALEGLELTMERVYPPRLERGRRPDDAYRRMVHQTAEERIALAGRRLADLLEGCLQ